MEAPKRQHDRLDGPVVGPPIPKKKKTRNLQFESFYLSQLPTAALYERSYMHRDVVTHIEVSALDFIITGSSDGFIKFWKKNPIGIEFVKLYRAHLEPITAMAVSADGSYLCTASQDKTVKICDVASFDIINMFKLDYVPTACCWVHRAGDPRPLLACSQGPAVHVYSATDELDKKGQPTPLHTLNCHRTPVTHVRFNAAAGFAISCDQSGMIEYWLPTDGQMPTVGFKFKYETDLFALAKAKTTPLGLCIAPTGSLFAVMSTDRQVRVFHCLTGKLYRAYDESLETIENMQNSSDESSQYYLENIEFGRRFSLEREIEKRDGFTGSLQIDRSGHFLLYPSLLGIKLVNMHTNRLATVLGKEEGFRFVSIALYQGRTEGSLEMDTKDTDAEHDPVVFATGLGRDRFYLLTRRRPLDSEVQDTSGQGRDVLNERPKQAVKAKGPVASHGNLITVQTTAGDIQIKLFTQEAPKASENFAVHARNGYYNNVLFHRVIKGFMIQTGDPLGDGTGGDSIWGKPFKDEIVPHLVFDKPFVVAMANRGPTTNGSQFFITTVPCGHLNGKHTIFGRVVKGMETVIAIESLPTKGGDRPREPPKILSCKVETVE